MEVHHRWEQAQRRDAGGVSKACSGINQRQCPHRLPVEAQQIERLLGQPLVRTGRERGPKWGHFYNNGQRLQGIYGHLLEQGWSDLLGCSQCLHRLRREAEGKQEHSKQNEAQCAVPACASSHLDHPR